MATVRVKSWHPPTQGPFVILDKATQYDPAVHTLYVEPPVGGSDEDPPPVQPDTAPRARARRKSSQE